MSNHSNHQGSNKPLIKTLDCFPEFIDLPKPIPSYSITSKNMPSVHIDISGVLTNSLLADRNKQIVKGKKQKYKYNKSTKSPTYLEMCFSATKNQTKRKINEKPTKKKDFFSYKTSIKFIDETTKHPPIVMKRTTSSYAHEKEEEEKVLRKFMRDNYNLKKEIVNKAENNERMIKIYKEIKRNISEGLKNGKNYKETFETIERILHDK